jgi:hypothetical protein
MIHACDSGSFVTTGYRTSAASRIVSGDCAGRFSAHRSGSAVEDHSIRALNEDLIFTVFLREAPDAKSTAYHRVGKEYVG